MKSLAIAVALLALAGLSRATDYNFSSGNITVSSIGSGPGDVVNISGTAVVTVNTNGPQIRAGVWNMSGGTLDFSASSYNRLAVQGFNWTGGTIKGRAGDTISTVNRWAGGLGNPILNGTFDIVGAIDTPFVFYCDSAAAAGRSKALTNSASNTIRIRNFEFQGYQGGWPSAGWTISATRNADNISIRRGLFDSSSFSAQLVTGLALVACRFKTYGSDNRAIILQGGGNDSLIGCRILHNALGGTNQAGAQGVHVWSNNAYIYGCNIKDSNWTGQFGGDYGINLEQNVGGTRIIADTVHGFEFTVATPGGNHPNVRIQYCKISGGSHESIILHNGDTGWKIYGNLLTSYVSGGRSTITVYCSATGAADGLEILYNTINALYGGNPASACVAFENTSAGTITYNNIKMVGNLMLADNNGVTGGIPLNRKEILIGTTTTQSAIVNFTEFKRNAFEGFAMGGSSQTNFPYSMADSNLETQNSFIFVDSTGGDFRLGVGSPMKNAGDSAYGCLVYGDFRAATKPFNIGADQNFYNRWLYQKRPWIRTAQMTYSGTPGASAGFLGRTTDILVNGSAIATSARTVDSMVKVINYNTMSSARALDYATGIPAYITKYDPSRTVADFTINVTGSAVTTVGQQGTGPNACEGDLEVSNPGSPLTFCGWTEPNRRVFKYANDWVRKYLCYDWLSDGITSEGIMEDEPSTFNAAFCCNIPTDMYGMMFPWGNGDITPSTWMNNVGYSGQTRAQVLATERAVRRGVTKRVVDTLNLYGFKHFGNITNYSLVSFDPYVNGQPSSVRDMSDNFELIRDFGAGAVIWENALTPFKVYGSWEAQCWQAMDSIAVWDTGQVITWLTIMPNDSIIIPGALGGWGRCQMQRLAFYYMASSRMSTFMLSSNLGGAGPLKPNDFVGADTVFKYVKAVERDIGQPTGPRFIAQQGTDPAGQAYILYRRNFQNAIVLYREANGTAYSQGNYTATSAVKYYLGTTGTPVNFDNTLGTSADTASVRSMEGQIWMTTAQPTISISLQAAFGNEGDSIPVIISATPSASARTYRFSITDNTAIANVNYVPITNELHTVEANDTADTVWVHSIRDFVDTQDKLANTSINSVSSGVIGTSQATVTIYDIDQPAPNNPVPPGGFIQGWRPR